MISASLMSSWVKPPASCVDKVTLTVLYTLDHSGWWSSFSATNAARAIKPNAWLKSLNTNVLEMASRPSTLRQPLSRASADLRASPVSFSAISVSNLLSAPSALRRAPVIGNAQHSQKVDQFLPNDHRGAIGLPCWEVVIGGGHGLVVEHRLGRRDSDPYSCDIPAVSRLDFRRQLCLGRSGGGLERAVVHGAVVPVRAAS